MFSKKSPGYFIFYSISYAFFLAQVYIYDGKNMSSLHNFTGEQVCFEVLWVFFFFHFTLLSPFQILIDCGCGGLFRGSLVCSIILHVCIRVKVKFLKSVSRVELSLSQKDTFKPKSLIPWNVILFGNGVSAEKIKPKWSSQNEP